MILIDWSQLIVANAMVNVKDKINKQVDEGLFRHSVLNSLLNLVSSFRNKYGEVVICLDHQDVPSWRRNVFPHYKAHRKKARLDSDIDWAQIFRIADKLREEFDGILPYKMVRVEGAEADDIIATLASLNAIHSPVLIISSDKDFLQLQRNKNVSQYSTILKRFVSTDAPELTLKEHIIRGDRGDGIPNILSQDDCFVVGKRQTPVMTKKVNEWLMQPPENFCDDKQIKNYYRNKMLIDFSFIPNSVSASIVDTYKDAPKGNRNKMFTYFADKGLKKLMSNLDEF